MAVTRAEQLLIREEQIGAWVVRVSSFRLGERWHASVESIDPGARIARGEGATRDEAEGIAVKKAGERLGRTRIHPPN